MAKAKRVTKSRAKKGFFARVSQKTLLVIAGAVLVTSVGGYTIYQNTSSADAAFISWPGCKYSYTIRRGSRGGCVKPAQAFYNNFASCYHHSYSLISTDGVFGPNTEKAMKDFQKAHGLKVDGIVGRNTWKKLDTWQHRFCSASPNGK